MEKIKRSFLLVGIVILLILLAISSTLAIVFGVRVNSLEEKNEQLQQESIQLRDQMHKMELDAINREDSPTPTVGPTPERENIGSCDNASEDDKITVEKPCQNGLINSNFEIMGTAEGLFEGAMEFEILSPNGELIKSKHITVAAPEPDQLGTFAEQIAWNIPEGIDRVTLKFYALSAADGSEEHVVEFSVRVDNK